MKWLAENKKRIIANVILIGICSIIFVILEAMRAAGNEFIIDFPFYQSGYIIATLIGGGIPGVIVDFYMLLVGLESYLIFAHIIKISLCCIFRKTKFSRKFIAVFIYAGIFTYVDIIRAGCEQFNIDIRIECSYITYLCIFIIAYIIRRKFSAKLDVFFSIKKVDDKSYRKKSVKTNLIGILNITAILISLLSYSLSMTSSQFIQDFSSQYVANSIIPVTNMFYENATLNLNEITKENLLNFENKTVEYLKELSTSNYIPARFSFYEIIDDSSLHTISNVNFYFNEESEDITALSKLPEDDVIPWSEFDKENYMREPFIWYDAYPEDDGGYYDEVHIYNHVSDNMFWHIIFYNINSEQLWSGYRATILSAAIILVMNLFAIWLYDKKIIIPLNRMTSAASNFAFDTEENREKFHEAFTALDIKSGDEIEQLYLAFNKTISDMDDYVTQIKEKSEQISEIQHNIILTMADIVESRDENTGGHIRRTAAYVEIISKKLREQGKFTDILTPQYESDMIVAAPLHDMGKIHVSDTILNKPGRLTDEEFGIMKSHTTAGKDMLENATNNLGVFSYLTIAVQMAAYHHEWWNGRGYPEGLSGNDIPLCARIMAVADVFDALMSKRCYKDAMPIEKAYSIIREETGTHFDPDVAEAFFAASAEIEACLNSME